MCRTAIMSPAAIVLAMVLLISGAGCVSRVIAPAPASATASAQGASCVVGVPIDAAWQLPPVTAVSQLAQLSIPDIVKKVAKSVVSIRTDTVTYDIFLQPVPAHGVGTGVIIDRKGYILTNNHVVENAKNIKVILFNGKAYDAKTANRDPYSDLAVVQISADGLEPADLGNSRDLLVGEGVVAVGNALALEGGPTVTAGIVSYIGRSIDIGSDEVLHDLIQTDAAINPGNSGGPLLNLAGQVIGVNTATAASGQNIGFAIAITPAMPIVQQLVRTGFISRPYLGLQLFTFDNGVAIIAVDKGSPAEKAGLLRGDIIAFCEGKPVATAGEMNDIVNSTAIGQSIKITFVRDGKEMQASAVLTNCPSK